MSKHPYLLASLLIAACGTVSETTPDDDPQPDAGVEADPDAAPEACDVSGLAMPSSPPETTTLQVLPSETARDGEIIRDTLQGTLKRHYIVIPDDPAQRRGLFVWLAGSGAEPHWFTAILQTAAAAGYVGVALAYDNETKVEERCGVEDDPVCGPTNPTCEIGVREEIVYGESAHDSTCVDGPDADSIEHRVLRLLQYAVDEVPDLGMDEYLAEDGTRVDWSKIAVGGWSQGGGHAGVIARDHRVARAVYASKGSDSTPCPALVDDPAACDVDGDEALSQDEYMVPSLWAHDPRATPGTRQFGAVHAYESAAYFSFETFELYGMAVEGTQVDLDVAGADFASYDCRHTFVTRATPASDPTDFHISMAIDGSLARDANGVPILAPFYYYALTVPVP
jgi:hypothetical protein